MRLAQAPRALACDTVTPIDAEMAAALYAIGVRTVFRYLDRVHDISPGQLGANLTAAELAVLLDAGLCVSPVQYYSTRYADQRKGRALSADYGAEMGQAAATNARGLGIPEGATIWRDLEDVPRATSAQIVTDLTGWARSALSAGYESGLYYGTGLGSAETGYLTGEDLWGLRYYRSYWRAASAVPQIPHRGPCVVQGSEQTIRLAGRELARVHWICRTRCVMDYPTA